MKNIMLDIECTGEGDNPVMVQLGACFFDINTGEIGKTFCKNLSVPEAILAGFTESQNTLAWWRGDETRSKMLDEILETGRPPAYVMGEFDKFIRTYGDIKKTKIWSHITYDFPIVQKYSKKFSKFIPYKCGRDIRTIEDLANLDKNKYDWSKKTHNALEDCIFQVEMVSDSYRILKNAK